MEKIELQERSKPAQIIEEGDNHCGRLNSFSVQTINNDNYETLSDNIGGYYDASSMKSSEVRLRSIVQSTSNEHRSESDEVFYEAEDEVFHDTFESRDSTAPVIEKDSHRYAFDLMKVGSNLSRGIELATRSVAFKCVSASYLITAISAESNNQCAPCPPCDQNLERFIGAMIVTGVLGIIGAAAGAAYCCKKHVRILLRSCMEVAWF